MTNLPHFGLRTHWQRYASLPRPTPAAAAASPETPPPTAAATAPVSSPAKPAKSNHHQASEVVKIRGKNSGAFMRININESHEGIEIVKKKGAEGNYDYGKKKLISGREDDKKELRKLNWLVMNGNFQEVNNSLLYNSSLTHPDAALHFSDV